PTAARCRSTTAAAPAPPRAARAGSSRTAYAARGAAPPASRGASRQRSRRQRPEALPAVVQLVDGHLGSGPPEAGGVVVVREVEVELRPLRARLVRRDVVDDLRLAPEPVVVRQRWSQVRVQRPAFDDAHR